MLFYIGTILFKETYTRRQTFQPGASRIAPAAGQTCTDLHRIVTHAPATLPYTKKTRATYLKIVKTK